jgi:phosphoenolpyruvate carboxykinase (GTP)
MRVLKWIVERCQGVAKAVDTPIGRIPAFADLEWKGLENFDGEKFKRVTRVDRADWKRELKLHDELLQLLGGRLPPELSSRRQVLERSLA